MLLLVLLPASLVLPSVQTPSIVRAAVPSTSSLLLLEQAPAGLFPSIALAERSLELPPEAKAQAAELQKSLDEALKAAGPELEKTLRDAPKAIEDTIRTNGLVVADKLTNEVLPAVDKAAKEAAPVLKQVATDLAPVAQKTADVVGPLALRGLKALGEATVSAATVVGKSALDTASVVGKEAISQASSALMEAEKEAEKEGLVPADAARQIEQSSNEVAKTVGPILDEGVRQATPFLGQLTQAGAKAARQGVSELGKQIDAYLDADDPASRVAPGTATPSSDGT